MNVVNTVQNAHAIQQILIEDLFGQFTYRLGADGNGSFNINSNLLILYGDNGSGKTTILQLLRHLLSPEEGKGHKTFVAHTPFQRFAVFFADGTSVEAKRDPNNISGAFKAIISKNQIAEHDIDYRTDDSGDLVANRDESEKEKTRAFTEALAKLNTSLFYLSDDRKIYEEFLAGRHRRRHRQFVQEPSHSTHIFTHEGYKYLVEGSRPEASPLVQAIERVYDWARDQAILGSGLGDRNTNVVYNDVVRLIIESPASESEEGVPSQIDQLRETLQTLSIRSKEYSKFGLVTPLNLDQMMSALSQLEEATPDKVRIVYNVLKLFAEGIDARLKALEGIHDTLQTFMDTLKLFYKNKLFSFKVRDGLKITAKKTNQHLDPKMLSSGEKQILLLFCNTIAAKDQATIFIIDEPEISLNVKWQRQLVQALLDCVRSSPVQFILATHSIELLARHKHNVVQLKNLKE